MSGSRQELSEKAKAIAKVLGGTQDNIIRLRPPGEAAKEFQRLYGPKARKGSK